MANIVVVSGRMVADPELRNISEDKAVCNFRIAVPKRFKPQEMCIRDSSYTYLFGTVIVYVLFMAYFRSSKFPLEIF